MSRFFVFLCIFVTGGSMQWLATNCSCTVLFQCT